MHRWGKLYISLYQWWDESHVIFLMSSYVIFFPPRRPRKGTAIVLYAAHDASITISHPDLQSWSGGEWCMAMAQRSAAMNLQNRMGRQYEDIRWYKMIIYRCYKNVSMQATDQFRGYSAKCCIGFRRVTGCQRRLAGQLGQPSRGSIHLHNSYRQTYPGWWFGNVWNIFYIPYIGNVIIPTDFHSIIFQRDGLTTKPRCGWQDPMCSWTGALGWHPLLLATHGGRVCGWHMYILTLLKNIGDLSMAMLVITRGYIL